MFFVIRCGEDLSCRVVKSVREDPVGGTVGYGITDPFDVIL